MAVDTGFKDWLKSPALYAVSTVAGVEAAYGDNFADRELSSPVALQADAQTEANRMRDFLKGPLARDRVVIDGLRSDLIGKLITVQGNRLGYDAGVLSFVIGVAEADDSNSTTLTVLRRL